MRAFTTGDIPSQTVADALLVCRRTVMRERLADAADEAVAWANGLVARIESA